MRKKAEKNSRLCDPLQENEEVLEDQQSSIYFEENGNNFLRTNPRGGIPLCENDNLNNNVHINFQVRRKAGSSNEIIFFQILRFQNDSDLRLICHPK